MLTCLHKCNLDDVATINLDDVAGCNQASMRIFIIALEYDHDEVDGGNHSLHSADENADALTAAETEATAMFGSESATSKKNGDVVR